MTVAFEWSITAERTSAVKSMTETEALRRGILPNGELVDDQEAA